MIRSFIVVEWSERKATASRKLQLYNWPKVFLHKRIAEHLLHMQVKLVFVNLSTAIATQEHISRGMSQDPEKLTMTAPRSMRIEYYPYPLLYVYCMTHISTTLLPICQTYVRGDKRPRGTAQ